MERFWTLKYLQQHQLTELDATVIKDGSHGGECLVRADTLPLVLPVLGAQGMARGARVRVRLGEIDEISLSVAGTVLARLDDPQDPSDDGPLDDEGEEDDAAVAGPLAIAVDVNDADADAPPHPATEPQPT